MTEYFVIGDVHGKVGMLNEGLESQPTPWVAPLSTEEAQVEVTKPKSRAKATKH